MRFFSPLLIFFSSKKKKKEPLLSFYTGAADAGGDLMVSCAFSGRRAACCGCSKRCESSRRFVFWKRLGFCSHRLNFKVRIQSGKFKFRKVPVQLNLHPWPITAKDQIQVESSYCVAEKAHYCYYLKGTKREIVAKIAHKWNFLNNKTSKPIKNSFTLTKDTGRDISSSWDLSCLTFTGLILWYLQIQMSHHRNPSYGPNVHFKNHQVYVA